MIEKRGQCDRDSRRRRPRHPRRHRWRGRSASQSVDPLARSPAQPRAPSLGAQVGVKLQRRRRRRPVRRSMTEGSVLSRGNLYSHRSGGAHLASVQNFRRGQLNFQGMPCVAALQPWRDGVDDAIRRRRHAVCQADSVSFGAHTRSMRIFSRRRTTGRTGGPATPCSRGWCNTCGAAITAYRAQEIQNLHVRGAHARVVPQEPVRRSARSGERAVQPRLGPLVLRSKRATATSHCSARWRRRGRTTGRGRTKRSGSSGDTNVFITQIGCAAEFGSVRTVHGEGEPGAGAHLRPAQRRASCKCSYDVPDWASVSSCTTTTARATAANHVVEDRTRGMRKPVRPDRLAAGPVRHPARPAFACARCREQARAPPAGRARPISCTTLRSRSMRRTWGCCPGPLYKGIDRDAALGAPDRASSAPISRTSSG